MLNGRLPLCGSLLHFRLNLHILLIHHIHLLYGGTPATRRGRRSVSLFVQIVHLISDQTSCLLPLYRILSFFSIPFSIKASLLSIFILYFQRPAFRTSHSMLSGSIAYHHQ